MKKNPSFSWYTLSLLLTGKKLSFVIKQAKKAACQWPYGKRRPFPCHQGGSVQIKQEKGITISGSGRSEDNMTNQGDDKVTRQRSKPRKK